MVSLYTFIAMRPRELLDRLVAEEAHVGRLAVSSQMWSTAAILIQEAEQRLGNRTTALLANAWHDTAGRAFGDAVLQSQQTMISWRELITGVTDPNANIFYKINEIVSQYTGRVAQVRLICDRYDKAVELNNGSAPSDASMYVEQAGQLLDEHDDACRAVTRLMRNLTQSAREWMGPRAAIPDGGAPGTPRSPGPAAAGAGTPAAAAPEPAAVDPGAPATVPTNSPTASDPLSTAASALEAAQGLLDGMQVPDAIPVPDPGGLGLDPTAYPEAQYGLPALSGFDAGASGGGASAGGTGAGTTAMTGPGTGGLLGVGNAPVAAGGLARGLATSVASSMPPMSPPMSGAGAGAAGTRKEAGIKPGNSDRPAAESRPRPRRGTGVTPGVALTGRAGAGAPKPAAQRSWDNENDSLQVLDEHLWQVNQPEEETHGQDRRQSGRDGRDRATAHRAPDAGLVGPGGSANQPTRAR